MSEMIERVARALCRRSGIDDPDYLDDEPGMLDGPQPYWRRFVGDAREAIAAMREPTDAMCFAGGDEWTLGHQAGGIWRAMIDAALEEPKT